MSKLRLGFLGLGVMGQRAHLINYVELAEKGLCEITAVADPRLEVSRLVAQRYGIPNVYRDHLEMLESGSVDAIVTALQYRKHPYIVPDILNAGVPVFTEKPLCLSVEAAERLASLGEDRGVLHMVGYHKRSDPAIEYAKQVIDEWKLSGEFGKLRYIRAIMPPGDAMNGSDTPLLNPHSTYVFEPSPELSDWEPLPTEFSEDWGKEYNLLVNLYIHQVNLIRFFLGESYQTTHGEKSQILLVGKSDSGVCVALEMAPYHGNFIHGPWAHPSTDWQESIIVCFEKGYVKVDLPAPLAYQLAGKVTIYRSNGEGVQTLTEPAMPNRHAMRQQAINFLAALRGERPAPCVAREAVEDLKVIRDYIRIISV